MRNDTLAWRTAFPTYEQFEQTFAPLEERAGSATKKRNYRAEALRKLSLVGRLGEDWTVLVAPSASGTLVREAGKVGGALSKKGLNTDQAVAAINHMMMQRLVKSGRGGTRIKGVTTTDYNKAAELTEEQLRHIPTYTDDDLHSHNLHSHNLHRLENGLFGPPVRSSTRSCPCNSP
jgi:hypothetical protein